MNIKEQIIEMMEKYRNEHGDKEPTELYLTEKDKLRLLNLDTDNISVSKELINEKMPSIICGMTTHDSKKGYSYLDCMDKEEVIKKVNLALDLFYENDLELISISCHERAISHKFACYLQILFKSYDVDCEYDKHGECTKALSHIAECSEEKSTDRILPDILIHKRNTDARNLIVFEIKSKSNATPCDIKKLELMTRKSGEFKYTYGFFIKFGVSRQDCKIDLYRKGKKKGE